MQEEDESTVGLLLLLLLIDVAIILDTLPLFVVFDLKSFVVADDDVDVEEEAAEPSITDDVFIRLIRLPPCEPLN